jgi:hypothetical protein
MTTQVKTTSEAYQELDESDKKFVDRQNKKDRKKILRELSGDERKAKAWGRNYFKKAQS